jgi:hypothetical protein
MIGRGSPNAYTKTRDLIKFTSRKGPVLSASTLSWMGSKGVPASRYGSSNPEFVDGPIHVCGAEGDVLKAALEWVVVTHSRPVDAQS